jgi:hypothetical protein
VPTYDKSRPQVQRLRILALLFTTCYVISLHAQPLYPRAWLAGRYDGSRVIVYFNAVHFGANPPADLRKLSPPVAGAFFDPFSLPNHLLTKFRKLPEWWPFSIGESYDLLLGGNDVVTVRVTDLVAAIGDEQVGNDSYVGGLANLTENGSLASSKDYFALQPHILRHVSLDNTHSALLDEPVPFNIQSDIASQLNQALNKPQQPAPAFTVQPFRSANGALRYYVRSEWREPGQDGKTTYARGAWFAWVPAPGGGSSVHILARQEKTSDYGFSEELPVLRNVVALDADTTGIIVTSDGEDSTSTCLLVYRDGIDLQHMSKLQCIEAGE